MKQSIKIFCLGKSCLLCFLLEISFFIFLVEYVFNDNSLNIHHKIVFANFYLLCLIFHLFWSQLVFIFRRLRNDNNQSYYDFFLINRSALKCIFSFYGKNIVFAFIFVVVVIAVATNIYPYLLNALNDVGIQSDIGMQRMGNLSLLCIFLISGLISILRISNFIEKLKSKE